MKKIFCILMLVVAISLMSCLGPVETNYVEGVVTACLDSTTSVADLYNYLTDYETLSIKDAYTIWFSSTLTVDQLDEVNNALDSKAYLHPSTSSAVYLSDEGELYMYASMKNASYDNIQDFISFYESYGFEQDYDRSGQFRFLIFQIPIGEEMKWKRTLENDNFFEWVDLEWLGERCAE